MQKERDLRERTITFAVAVLRFCRTLPDDAEGRHVRGQLLRAGTGTAANYRAACRGKSRADFAAKLGTVIEEADESDFWLDFAVRANITDSESARSLRNEANELVAIFTQSQKTARRRTLTQLLISAFFVLFTSALFALLTSTFTSAFSNQHSAM